MPFCQSVKCIYVREASDDDILESVKDLVGGAVSMNFLLTTRKVRGFMERNGLVCSSRHISAILARQADRQGWRKVELRYHQSNHSPCLGYFVRRG